MPAFSLCPIRVDERKRWQEEGITLTVLIRNYISVLPLCQVPELKTELEEATGELGTNSY